MSKDAVSSRFIDSDTVTWERVGPGRLKAHAETSSSGTATIIAAISFIIDGSGSTITTGVKGDIEVPFNCTINQVTLLADQSGSIVVDIWKDSYANYPPTGADSITASAKPTITTATKSIDATLTGWTTSITAGQTLRFNVDSCTSIARVTLTLKVSLTLSIGAIAFIIDGGGSTITTGIKGDLEIPFDCTINRVTMLADQSGSIVVDIWKDAYGNYPPTGADSITASAKPTISSATKAQDTTLTGWSTAITAGQTLRFNVDSVTTIQRVALILKITRS